MAKELEPHPLVVGLAEKLADPKVKTAIKTAKAAVAAALDGAPAPPGPTAKDLEDFGAAPNRVDLIKSFAGYLGGSVKDPIDPKADYRWQLLFLDMNLSSWLIFRSKDIVYFDRVRDESAAGGVRDHLWVGSDALVGRGDTASSAAAIVRGGSFSRAGDVATSMRGDTNARRGGLLFDGGTSPPCCGGNSRR